MMFLILSVVAALCMNASAVRCNGTLIGPLRLSSVEVIDRDNCELENVDVAGVVTVENGGRLRTLRDTRIQSITATNWSGDITLAGFTRVSGNIRISAVATTLPPPEGAYLQVVAFASVGGEIRSRGPSNMHLTSSVNSVFASDSHVFISNGRTGLVQLSGKSTCSLCNANITSNLNMLGMPGKLTTSSPGSCRSSTIAGDLSMDNGRGPIELTNLAVGNMFRVSGRSGAVKVENSSFKSILINSTRNGDISLDGVSVTETANLWDNQGAISITRSRGGIYSLLRNKNSTSVIDNPRFQLFQIRDNQGAVVFQNNNGGFGDLHKNLGGVDVRFNTLDRLECAGNNPPPTVGPNNVIHSEGQCAVPSK